MSGDRDPQHASQALQRLITHPALSEVLPTLAPRTLTRLYDAVGLHDAGALMAATPPGLVAQALDDAAWRDSAHGQRFDADVFVDWLEVWLDAGATVAAERLWALDDQVLALAFAELLAVDDGLVAGFGRDEEDPHLPPDHDAGFVDDAATTVIDRFLVRARQADEWDIAQAALLALWDDDADRLVALLNRLSVVSGAGRRRLHQDAAADREDRRERSGFVSAEAARSFLGSARVLTPEALADMREYDPESARHLARLGRWSEHAESTDTTDDRGDVAAAEDPPAPAPAAAEVEALLRQAGVTGPLPAAARLTGPAAATPTLLEQRLQTLVQQDPQALAGSGAELAYLANVLQATSAAGSDDGARTLASAVTNLGMELLEARGLAVTPGREPGLIQPFLLGWRALLELPGRLLRAVEEGLAAPTVAQRLAARSWLADDIEQSVDDLRRAVGDGDHETGREALSLLSLVFDPAACRAARHLLAEPPAFPVALDGGTGDAQRPLRTLDELSRVYRLLQALARGATVGTSAERGVQQHHQREPGHQ